MTNELLQIKIKQRLNKLASFDYDNIECWQIQEAFNKAQIEWVRRCLHGLNQTRESVESTLFKVDDVQVLLTDTSLRSFNKNVYYETEKLPKEYLQFVRVGINAFTECCNENRSITVYLAEESNVSDLLTDAHKSHSFEWGETFCTIVNNKLRIYTNKEFEVETVKLVYYRKPKEVGFKNCININTGESYSADILCELKDDVIELVIDDAASIIAGDIESQLQYQRGIQSNIRNS